MSNVDNSTPITTNNTTPGILKWSDVATQPPWSKETVKKLKIKIKF